LRSEGRQTKISLGESCTETATPVEIQNRKRPAPARPNPVRARALLALKIAVFAVCLVPLVLLLLHGFQNDLGPDPIATVTHATGFATLRLLVITLAITPVRRLSARLSWLIRFRRMLGLFAFFYGCLHLLTYVWLFAGFNLQTIVDDIAKRRYVLAGFTAWLLLVPLALTSTTWSIRKLGGKRWQMLHRLVYLSATAGVVHYWWIVKPGVRTPLTITLVLSALLIARPLWSLSQARKGSSTV
jgi:sulfoxide reductase heme-binding subunit YedZ